MDWPFHSIYFSEKEARKALGDIRKMYAKQGYVDVLDFTYICNMPSMVTTRRKWAWMDLSSLKTWRDKEGHFHIAFTSEPVLRKEKKDDDNKSNPDISSRVLDRQELLDFYRKEGQRA